MVRVSQFRVIFVRGSVLALQVLESLGNVVLLHLALRNGELEVGMQTGSTCEAEDHCSLILANTNIPGTSFA